MRNNPVSLTDPSGYAAAALAPLGLLGPVGWGIAGAVALAATCAAYCDDLYEFVAERLSKPTKPIAENTPQPSPPPKDRNNPTPAPWGSPDPAPDINDEDDKKRFAMGRNEHLDEFAAKRNAETWKDYPQDPWYNTVERKLFDPLEEKLFNLQDIEDPLSEAQAGIEAMNAGMHPDNIPGVQFELGTIMENDLEEDIDWWDGDERKDEDYNPFEDQ